MVLILALVLIPVAARAEIKTVPLPPTAHWPTHVAAAVDQAAPAPRSSELTSAVTLADIGFVNGLRLSNLGGHQELFVPLPQDGLVTASELVLVLDDLSAYDAKRNLEVQANDRTVAAIALDGKSRGRIVRIPLGGMRPKDGYIKLLFLYSGAATLDRCIDVRYVGDSLTVRPESAIEVAIGAAGSLDVATTAMLMPREAAIVLPSRRVTENEIATAVTVARSLISSGRRVSFYHGYETAAELAKRDANGRWARGVVLIGPLPEVADVVDAPLARVAGPAQPLGTLAAIRIGGTPALLVSDTDAVRAGQLFASPLRAATRGMGWASVGDSGPSDLPTDSVTFEQLAVPAAQAEVFGRANLTTVIDIRKLPPETRPARLLLNVMVAPDGAGEKAVVSTFVNDRLLGSTVAAIGEPTHLDLALPPGLVGSIANVRALVQRDSAQGDCRFEAQGYPAQILGSSALALTSANGKPHDFPDLTAHFVRGVRLIVPASAADQPIAILGMLAEVANHLTPDVAPLSVMFTANSGAPVPDAPFIAIGDRPPSGAKPRVHFDRGRVEVTDRSGRTLLDLGGFGAGAVAQLVNAGDYPGLWIKPLAADGSAPYPADLHLDHGDVAFIDNNGVALAMSTERDTVVRVSYPDQVSWLTIAERFRSWIVAALWLFATAALLFILQRLFRRRTARTSE
ncbi:MAG TPA: hypothetical protein VMV19_07395 [Xanthobacteraceae bacterium]|nr:hypothetical protein [Xanthobacteraceae bacterium]